MTLRVLLLEDTPEKRDRILAALHELPDIAEQDVTAVADANAARHVLRARLIDLLVIDLAVPEGSGTPVDVDAGVRLLDDLWSESTLHMPGAILGVTAYDDLVAKQEALFAMKGVVLARYSASSDGWRIPLMMLVRQVAARKRALADQQKQHAAFLGVVCALPDEFRAVEALPWGFQELRIEGDPTVYIEGHVPRKAARERVVVALAARMGIGAASIAATKLIDAIHPRYLAMTGITGGIRGRVQLGDVVVAEECWDWGMGKWAERDGHPLFVPGPHHLALDADVRTAVQRLARNEQQLAAIRAAWPGNKPTTALQLVVGPVASGASVLAALEMSEQVAAQHRKLIGIDMEAYGIFAAAAEAVSPRPIATVIKAVSDFADGDKADTIRHYGAHCSAAVMRTVFEEYV